MNLNSDLNARLTVYSPTMSEAPGVTSISLAYPGLSRRWLSQVLFLPLHRYPPWGIPPLLSHMQLPTFCILFLAVLLCFAGWHLPVASGEKSEGGFKSLWKLHIGKLVLWAENAEHST